MRYQTVADANLRLSNCIVKLGDFYYTVAEVGGSPPNIKGVLARLDNPEYAAIEADLNDPDLDISSVPLGYIPTSPTAVFLARRPSRTQNQGVCINKLSFINPFGVSISGQQVRKNILTCILNKYPKYSEAIIAERDTPFSREFCIHIRKHDYQPPGMRYLGFCGELAGFYRPGSTRLNLLPAFNNDPFKDLLQENGVE